MKLCFVFAVSACLFVVVHSFTSSPVRSVRPTGVTLPSMGQRSARLVDQRRAQYPEYTPPYQDMGVQCKSGEYMNPEQSSECLQCPGNSTSLPGSYYVSSCWCQPGMQMDTNNMICKECPEETTSECQCPAGWYSTGWLQPCAQCADGATSPDGSWISSQCYCTSGYYGDGSQCTQCPAGSLSAAKSPTIDLCKCPANQYLDIDTATCTSCPASSTSDSGSSSINSCSCAMNTYLNTVTSTCTACPSTQVSSAGSLSCKCPANTYLDAQTTLCTACPAGSTSNGSVAGGISACTCSSVGMFLDLETNTCVGCPTGSLTDSSITGPESCYCPVDTYLKADSTECEACPLYSNTANTTGNEGIASCICRQPWHVKSADGLSCVLNCPSNSFADIGLQTCVTCVKDWYMESGVCVKCPRWSVSSVGSQGIGSCLCMPGTYFEATTRRCLECGPDNVCSGNGIRQACAVANPGAQALCQKLLKTKTAFSTSAADCECYDSGEKMF